MYTCCMCIYMFAVHSVNACTHAYMYACMRLRDASVLVSLMHTQRVCNSMYMYAQNYIRGCHESAKLCGLFAMKSSKFQVC